MHLKTLPTVFTHILFVLDQELLQRKDTSVRSPSNVTAKRRQNKEVAQKVAVEANSTVAVTVVAAVAATEDDRHPGHEKVISAADMIEVYVASLKFFFFFFVIRTVNCYIINRVTKNMLSNKRFNML